MQSFQSRVVAAMFGLLVLLTLVIDELGAVIRRILPEPAETPKPVA